MFFCRFEDYIFYMFGLDVFLVSWDLDKKYKFENLLVRFIFFMNVLFCFYFIIEFIEF